MPQPVAFRPTELVDALPKRPAKAVHIVVGIRLGLTPAQLLYEQSVSMLHIRLELERVPPEDRTDPRSHGVVQ